MEDHSRVRFGDLVSDLRAADVIEPVWMSLTPGGREDGLLP
jgi:hypothetical protein